MMFRKLNLFILLSFSISIFAGQPQLDIVPTSDVDSTDLSLLHEKLGILTRDVNQLKPSWFSYIFSTKTLVGLSALGLTVYFFRTFASPRDLECSGLRIASHGRLELDNTDLQLNVQLGEVSSALQTNNQDLKGLVNDVNLLNQDLIQKDKDRQRELSSMQNGLIQLSAQSSAVHESASSLNNLAENGYFSDIIKQSRAATQTFQQKGTMHVSALIGVVQNSSRQIDDRLDQYNSNEQQRHHERIQALMQMQQHHGQLTSISSLALHGTGSSSKR